MEENKEILQNEEAQDQELFEKAEAYKALEKEHYVPRPRWQIAAAWVGLAIVIAGVILYYYNIATGGL